MIIYIVPLIGPPLSSVAPGKSGAPGEFLSLKINPGGMPKGKGNAVSAGMIVSPVNGSPTGQVAPVSSVMAWFGMKPAGRMRGRGIGVFGDISKGLDTPPPIPQHVDVISLARSHI